MVNFIVCAQGVDAASLEHAKDFGTADRGDEEDDQLLRRSNSKELRKSNKVALRGSYRIQNNRLP